MIRKCNKPRTCGIAALVVALATLAPMVHAASPAFADPLDHPARTVGGIDARPMMSIALAGERLVAAGSRGVIAVSDDEGKSWKQATVPVQCDLLALHFVDATTGWAVGHDGVVLRTDDGGGNWTKQFDVRAAGASFRSHYEQNGVMERPEGTASRGAGDPGGSDQQQDEFADADDGVTPLQGMLDQVDRNFSTTSALPYLDVWFDDKMHGYAVGSYGILVATQDGGKTWQPWLDRIDSDQLNLNTIRGIDGKLFIAGERGRIYWLNRETGRFVTVETGYAGSFFGLVSNGEVLLAYGLRGVTYRSDDGGETWQAQQMPTEATITSGTVIPGSGQLVLVNNSGQLLVDGKDGRTFEVASPQRTMRLTGALGLPGSKIVLAGLRGVTVESLPSSSN